MKHRITIKFDIDGVLLILFIILKLTHVIDWPWVFVLLPLWVGIGTIVIVLIMFLIVYLKNK